MIFEEKICFYWKSQQECLFLTQSEVHIVNKLFIEEKNFHEILMIFFPVLTLGMKLGMKMKNVPKNHKHDQSEESSPMPPIGIQHLHVQLTLIDRTL